MSVLADMFMVMKSKLFADALKKGDYEVKTAREWTAFSSKDDWETYSGEQILGGAFLIKISSYNYSVVTFLDTDTNGSTPTTSLFRRVDTATSFNLSFIRADKHQEASDSTPYYSFELFYMGDDGTLYEYSAAIEYKRLRTDE